VHADGIGQTVDRTALIRFVQRRPASPIWQSGRLKVVVVRGIHIAPLGPSYVVSTVSDADLYRAVDPIDPHAAAAVVVDLATVPLSSLASLHALLPEVRIIGLTTNRETANAARAVGVHAVVVKRSKRTSVTQMVKALVPRR